MAKPMQIGGQAVIEGVMMRGPGQYVAAVRTPDGAITTKRTDLKTWGDRWPLFKLPIFRGLAALVESMSLGISTLVYSANQAGEEEEQLSQGEMNMTILVALVIGTGLFIIAPVYLTRFMRAAIPSNLLLNIVEFSIRISFFILYVYLVSRMEDIQRVFAYHGAEHKAVHAYEAGLDLTVENVRKQSTLHPRCGTSFILIVFMVSMLFFVWIGWDSFFWRILSRLLLLPVIAGVSYEIIRAAGKSRFFLLQMFCKPGMMLQKLTTREPDDGQIEVAIRALEGVIGSTSLPTQDN
jgi:uncharacterized protein YqhQ